MYNIPAARLEGTLRILAPLPLLLTAAVSAGINHPPLPGCVWRSCSHRSRMAGMDAAVAKRARADGGLWCSQAPGRCGTARHSAARLGSARLSTARRGGLSGSLPLPCLLRDVLPACTGFPGSRDQGFVRCEAGTQGMLKWQQKMSWAALGLP